MKTVKINRLEIENVKRIKAVSLKPTENGLTIIGGNNNQGKTSILDSITWALGGNKYRPSDAGREGSAVPPMLHIVMNNGLIVERKGKNSDLKITDPEGNKGGQQLLDDFVEELAINLPKFMESTGKEKAKTLLKIIGVGDQLEELEREEKDLYGQRLVVGRIADQKEKFAKEQPYYPEAPKDLVSISELIRQQQEILARNGENQKKREKAKQYAQTVAILRQEVEAMKEQLAKKQGQLTEAEESLHITQMDAKDLEDESTAELEQSISDIEETNRKVRANLDKEKAEEDAREQKKEYDALTSKISKVREDKTKLLEEANLPLPGLSVKEGELVFHGQKWDNMSGSDRLKVSTAIVRKLNPKCGFVLLDKLEQMDLETLQEFGEWLEEEGLQAIATRVSVGNECSVLISDGYSCDIEDGNALPDIKNDGRKKWKAGEF